jgi:hypothetical protein
MNVILGDAYKSILNLRKIKNDDFVDRINSHYTVFILISFCILVSSAQYVGHPISCWCPAEYTTAMVQYTNYVCWIANTYYVPSNKNLPNPNQPRLYIAYYQWVPFILITMSILFYLPSILWSLMLNSSNLNPNSLMKLLQSNDIFISTETHDKMINNVAKLIDQALNIHFNQKHFRRNSSFLFRFKNKISRSCLPKYQSGRFLSFLYIFIKFLYCINVFGQFFLLNLFMGIDYNIYGYQVIQDLINGVNFWESPRFPRLTICDFTVRSLGNNNNMFTIQCTLPINLFNEKIFIFIWFWLCFVAFLTFYSILISLISFSASSRMSFIKRYFNYKINNQNRRYFLHNYLNNNPNHIYINLESPRLVQQQELNLNSNRNKRMFKLFIFDYLKHDGILLLWIIKKNTNDIIVGELIHLLWNHFNK